ncbi:HAD-IA family hydrolase [Nocardia seriolae]|uniref:Sugar-phosphatase n=1 Tax=Nocardia seriolae TaxID=37332 RepID=A0A0B8NE42_9NOCA|nr:HAD-IA family hydrolase [Nocardia seriolae]APA99973.1 Sugar-phosphatase [Nocardia seriolae]MTJ64655.1 HAD-IA family hydrolase [Nocardia seriolae]MTJ73034.1 HAD-IA family hydrolase [Nocardia seriolae]MTJ89498.1 HAD-IA family hydrolase [Nocardia seriolae]MTK33473.1 HAD-IA family hydrolase [Nocardia seriolae]
MSGSITTLSAAGLLFDMDGTLVDSAVAIDAVWASFARRHGISPGLVRTVLPGRTARDIITTVLPDLGDVGAELAWITAREEAVAEEIREISGARMLLGVLPAHRWAVVTSASRAMARRRLALAGLPLPQVLVGAEDVRVGKPDPEGFRKAAGLLGLDIENCLVFEDSVPGLEAAARSGAIPVAVGEAAAVVRIPDLSGVVVRRDGDRLTVELHR